MPRSRGWVGGLAAILVLAACSDQATTEPDAEPSPSGSTSEAPEDPAPSETPVAAEKVRLDLELGISQPGARPAPSRDHVATVTVEPPAAGARVLLQQRGPRGWRTTSRGRQDDTGTATFAVVPAGEGVATYRAAVANPDGSVVRSRPARTGWRSVFRDEFDGQQLDASAWDHRQLGLYNPEGSRQCSRSDRSAVRVGGGALRLQVRQDPARRGEVCSTPQYGEHDYYLNGHVSTEGRYDFTYGTAAARIKFQRGRGQHGAFWLQVAEGATNVPGRPDLAGAEVDIVEFFGEGYPKGGLASFLYYRTAPGVSKKVGGLVPRATEQLPPGDTWWDRYHVFSVEWTPERYVFRVDGRTTYTSTEGVSGTDEFLILSLLSSDWELKNLQPDTLPSTMSVDWVRVWQRP